MNDLPHTAASGHGFHPTGKAERHQLLFTVNPDIPIADALESVSELLSLLKAPLLKAAMGEEPLQGDSAFSAVNSLAAAKAVVDSLIVNLDDFSR